MALVNQLIMFNKNILKRKSKFCSALYFNKDIYGYFDYNTKDISINEENTNKYSRRISQFELNMIAKKFSKKLFFVFNNYKILDQFMRKIFYGINIIKYKYKYYKSIYDDCVLLEFENNLINENFINENETKNLNLNKTFESELLKDIFNKNDFRRKLRKAVSVDYDTEDNNLINLLDKKNNILDNAGGIKKDFSRDLILNNKQNEEFINCSNSSIGRSNSEEEFNSNKKRLRHNVERKKNNCENFNNYRNSLEESITIKSDFEKVSFEVNLCYYFSKESRVINIYKDGIFTIYKKGKIDDILSSTLNDIISIEGESDSNIILLTVYFNLIKKSLWIEFANNFEKYIFKSLYYNRMIESLRLLQIKSQLKLNVNVMTWNVAGIDVPDDLGILFNTKTLENIDIFSIGVQECSVFKINDWQKHLKTLMAYYGFLDVTSIHMCQMFLIVFIKSQYLPFVENVTSSYKPMGFAKIVGNKGGIGISFKLFSYILTFINCHLAPKTYKVLERNNHAKNIVRYLRIGEKFADFDITSDYLFWKGDLNYRVDHGFEQTVEKIKEGNLKVLLLKDQLIKQRQTNQVFYEFKEPDINFNPTYRRQKGTDEYSNKKGQSPSWCDRIMVKTDRDIDLIYYNSVKEVKHSDHLPVLGKFSIYLTIPRFNEIEKIMTKSLTGKIIYSKIKLEYDFTEAFSEMNFEEKYPMKIKILAYHFLNKIPAETKTKEIKNISQLEEVLFDDLVLHLPPQCVFDLPHARAINIIFVINLTVGKYSYDMGFSKYSFEKVEKENLNILSHTLTSDITWRTRRLGLLSFEAIYKF